MTSNFSINHVFESDLHINITINDGIFTTFGQTFIIQHNPSIQLLKNLISWDHVVLNTSLTNYFEIEYRSSFDTITWTPWVNMPNDFNNFLDPNTFGNVWLQVKYKYISDNTGVSIELKELNINGIRTVNEIFEPTIITPGDVVTYTNQDTYKVFSLNDFELFLQDNNPQDLNIAIRYTQTQGRYWSDWVPLNSENLQKLKFERLKFVNFQFSFQNIGNVNVNLYDLELIGEFQNVTANYATIARMGLKTQCNPLATTSAPTCDAELRASNNNCVPCSQALTPWNTDISVCNPCNNFVQINDKSLWQNQIKLYAELNDFINQVNSWKVTYLLTDADGKGIDHLLHEQQIHNVISKKDINVIIPNNQFPVDTLYFSGLDLDLIQSFEIHITKESFKKVFGVEFRPSKRDVVYICDINQLWEVEQMFPKRGFMNAETYYRVLMKKYSDRKSRQFAKTTEGEEAKLFVDELTKYTTLDVLFDIDVNAEVKKVTKDLLPMDIDNPSQQYTEKTIMNLRTSIHNKVSILDNEIWNATLTVAKNVYEMPVKSRNLKLVEYVSTDQTMNIADNRAFTMWFKTQEYDPTYDWTLLSNYDYSNNTGYKINIFSGALTYQYNNNAYSIPVASMLPNTWYVILVNMDQVKNKLELAVYTRQNEIGRDLTNSQLVLFNKMIFDIIPDEYTHDSNLFVGGCDTFISTGNTKKWYLTNIRIWNDVIEKTKRTIVLNENVVNDAQLTIIVDNAERDFSLPKYGNF
jgi:signal peptidase I